MPDSVIKRVNTIGQRERQGRDFRFLNRQKEPYEWTDTVPEDDPEFQGLLEEEAPFPELSAQLPGVPLECDEDNEAFAAVAMRFMQELKVPHEKVNVNGGAIAMGHPLGATGAIIIGTLLDELERTGKSTGLATLCIASGMGAATIIERV